MAEPIKANTRLRCAIRRCGFGQPAFEARTEQLARDFAIVLVDAGVAPGWLRPGVGVSAGFDLPVHAGCTARVLECGATVRGVQRDGARVQLSLDIKSMAIAERAS